MTPLGKLLRGYERQVLEHGLGTAKGKLAQAMAHDLREAYRIGHEHGRAARLPEGEATYMDQTGDVYAGQPMHPDHEFGLACRCPLEEPLLELAQRPVLTPDEEAVIRDYRRRPKAQEEGPDGVDPQ